MNKFQFLSIGGNCAGIHVLAERRIAGPVDNMKSKNGLDSVKAIFGKGGLIKEFFEVGEIEQPFMGNPNNSEEIWYSTKNYFIIHNNFRGENFKKELIKRINVFYSFLEEIKISNTKFFIYSLNEKDIDPISKKMSDKFIAGIKTLKKYEVFEKTIFLMIKSVDKKIYDYKCNDIYNYSNKIIDMDISIKHFNDNYIRFFNKFNEIIDVTKGFKKK